MHTLPWKAPKFQKEREKEKKRNPSYYVAEEIGHGQSHTAQFYKSLLWYFKLMNSVAFVITNEYDLNKSSFNCPYAETLLYIVHVTIVTDNFTICRNCTIRRDCFLLFTYLLVICEIPEYRQFTLYTYTEIKTTTIHWLWVEIMLTSHY